MIRKRKLYHIPTLILLSFIFTLTPPFSFASSQDDEARGQKSFIKAAQTLSELDTSDEELEKEEKALPCSSATSSSKSTVMETATSTIGIAGMLSGLLMAGMGLFYQIKGKRHRKKARNLLGIGAGLALLGGGVALGAGHSGPKSIVRSFPTPEEATVTDKLYTGSSYPFTLGLIGSLIPGAQPLLPIALGVGVAGGLVGAAGGFWRALWEKPNTDRQKAINNQGLKKN